MQKLFAQQAEDHPSPSEPIAEPVSESQSKIAEASAIEAPAEKPVALPNAASPTVDVIAPEAAASEQKDSPSKIVEQTPVLVEEVVAATFADAGKDEDKVEEDDQIEAKATVENTEQPVSGTVVAAAVAVENQNSSTDSGGEESMGKSGKSNWHQIRTSPAASAASGDAVEAAKAERSAEEAPKAMAAAASADGSASASVSASTTDASTIASIVDSVMADLRPKIVEEIAKKLAGK